MLFCYLEPDRDNSVFDMPPIIDEDEGTAPPGVVINDSPLLRRPSFRSRTPNMLSRSPSDVDDSFMQRGLLSNAIFKIIYL